jgi:site-specific recombinase XerC
VKDKAYRRYPIGEDVGRFLRALRWQDASDHTLHAYEVTLSKLAVRFADLELSQLAPPGGVGLICDFLDAEWGATRPATRRARLAACRSFFRWAVSEGRVPADPTQTLKAPRGKSRERSAYTLDVVQRLADAQPLRDAIAIMLLGRLGLRRDELRRLRISDFDLARQTVTVNGKGDKTVVMPLVFEELRGALTLHIAAEDRLGEEYLLYPKAKRTRPMNEASVHRWFKRCLEKAGMPQSMQLHELRHSAGDALYRATGDIVLAQQLLRHENVATTRRYLHPTRDDLVEAMRQLDRQWRPARVSG